MKYGVIASLVVATIAIPTAYAEKSQWYFGAGVGKSDLSPDVADVSTGTDDGSDAGFKVIVGNELTDHLALEAFYADLGEAELDDGRNVSYEYLGAAAILSAGNNNAGLSGFLKGGLASQNTQVRGGSSIEDNLQPYGAAGSEYQLENGVTFRGEYEVFTNDSSLLSVSVMKRMGEREEPTLALRNPNAELAKVAAATGPRLQQKLPVRVTPRIVNVADSDQDGVMNERDRCPDTPTGSPVNPRGCPGFLGVVAGIDFEPNSDYLNANAKLSLDRVAREMRKYPAQQFVIVGHADPLEAGDKRRLSLKRALQASKHLVSRGVASSRLRFAGYGQSKPRARNDSSQARLLNRRIEIFLPGK